MLLSQVDWVSVSAVEMIHGRGGGDAEFYHNPRTGNFHEARRSITEFSAFSGRQRWICVHPIKTPKSDSQRST